MKLRYGEKEQILNGKLINSFDLRGRDIMPNKKAKERKRIKSELNKSLNINGRTAKQIKRIKLRNVERKRRLEERRKKRELLR